MDVDPDNSDVIPPPPDAQPDPMDDSIHDQSTLHDLDLPSFLDNIPVVEESIHDATADESFEGDPVTTYHIEESTSIRGCKKLYDSLGYSYVVRRNNSEFFHTILCVYFIICLLIVNA